MSKKFKGIYYARGGSAAADALVNASDPKYRNFTQPVADLADKVLPGGAANKFLDIYYAGIGALGNLLGGKSDEQRRAEAEARRAEEEAKARAAYESAQSVYGPGNSEDDLLAALADAQQTGDWSDYTRIQNARYQEGQRQRAAANPSSSAGSFDPFANFALEREDPQAARNREREERSARALAAERAAFAAQGGRIRSKRRRAK